MKIVHVIPGLTRERGGTTAIVEGLVREQVATHEVTVLTTDQGARNGEQASTLADGVRLVRSEVRGPDRWSYSPEFAALAARELAACDLVQVHTIFTYPSHVALRTAHRLGRPVVLTPAGVLHPYSLQKSRLIKAAYLARYGASIRRAVSAWHYASQAEADQSWPHDRSPRFIVPYGVRPEQFRMSRPEAAAVVARLWPQLADVPYVLFLSRLHRKKNVEFLVRQFLATAPGRGKLVVAGPDEENLWADIARSLPAVAERVVRIPMVTGEARTALLARATVFALSSEHENFGIVALEALAAGAPVLLSPHVDMAFAPELQRWVQVAPLEPQAWQTALTAALARPLSTTDDGELRAVIDRHYSWAAIARSMDDRYHWVLAGCPTVQPSALTTALPS